MKVNFSINLNLNYNYYLYFFIIIIGELCGTPWKLPIQFLPQQKGTGCIIQMKHKKKHEKNNI